MITEEKIKKAHNKRDVTLSKLEDKNKENKELKNANKTLEAENKALKAKLERARKRKIFIKSILKKFLS